MGYEVNYNDVALHEFMGILKIRRSILPERTNFSRKIPSVYGEVYTGFTYSPNLISMDCYITAENYEDHMEQLRIIGDLLNVTEPAKLIASDEPDKFNYAVFNGSLEVERVGYHGTFTIEFVCYDPFAYAIEPADAFIDEKKVVQIHNGGSMPTQPVVNVNFHNTAHFLQLTNYAGETVLIGDRPDADKPNGSGTTKVLSDNCESMATWTPAGNVLDADVHREVMGNVAINAGGYALYCNDFGTSDLGWHGGAVRRNIGQNVRNFEARVYMRLNSVGDINGTGSGKTAPLASAFYDITAKTLTVRAGRGNDFKSLGTLKKGKRVEVSNINKNWGLISFNGQVGFIHLRYAKKYNPPIPPIKGDKYESTVKCVVRQSASSKSKILTTAKKGTKITLEAISGHWLKMSVNGKTGWSYINYWKRTSLASRAGETNPLPVTGYDPNTSTENQRGRIEVYGFDANGQKLFKFVFRDSEYYYEYTQPEVWIGNDKVIQDGKTQPPANVGLVKNSDGKYVEKSIDSGKFGDWNDSSAWFTVARTTDSKGRQVWNAKVEKVDGDKVVKTLKTKSITKSSYPTGDLNNIVVWFGQYNDNIVCETMTVNHVYVYDKKPVKAEENQPIFEAEDELVVDFEQQKVYLNDIEYMESVDIGSQFFSSPSGESQFIVVTDDEDADVNVTYTEKWL